MGSGNEAPASAGQQAQEAGQRVGELLTRLHSDAGPRAAAVAEELVACLVGLYGAGLAEIVRILGDDAEAGQRLLARLADDPLVESLLLIHDLHPVDIAVRVEQALDRVRPHLGSRTAEQAGIDADGVLHVRLGGSGHACASSAATIREAIERVVAEAAPEASAVSVEDVPAPAGELPLLQITRRPAVAG